MNKRNIAVFLAITVLAFSAGCGKNKDTASETTDTSSSAADESTDTALRTEDTPNTPDKPKKSIYDFPYKTDEIRNDLISYGESLGLTYDDELTMRYADSITNNQTRAAANGKALERWCKKDLDNIEKIAKYRDVDEDDVSFNVIIYDSPDYGGEYIIGIYAKTN